MYVPGNALRRYLRMFAQKIERVSWRARIELLSHELGLLFGRLVFHARPAIEDRQVVVRGKIVGIDPLQLDKLFHCLVVLMLLVVGDAQLPARIARVRVLPDHFEEIGHFYVLMAGPPLDQAHHNKEPARYLG